MTAQETAEYLKQKGLSVDVRTVKRYRARIRESAQNWVARLAKSKRAEYIAEYKERIDEVHLYKRELLKLVDDDRVDAHTKIEAIGKLRNCTGQPIQL
jgi:formiminotetrahydrofolate cyclodeaminase